MGDFGVNLRVTASNLGGLNWILSSQHGGYGKLEGTNGLGCLRRNKTVTALALVL